MEKLTKLSIPFLNREWKIVTLVLLIASSDPNPINLVPKF